MSEDFSAKLEFEIQELDVQKLESLQKVLLSIKGINGLSAKLDKNKVVIETVLPAAVVQNEIETCTNSSAVLRGMGSKTTEYLESAVSEIANDENKQFNINGVIRFVQLDNENCAIDGTIDGLTPGEHGLHIYEYGDLSKGFEKLGNHFNPHKKSHGLNTDEERHAGDLGNILADSNGGRASFRIVDKQIKIWDIIGRSICVSEKPDTRKNDTGEKLACGIIARSSGLFENEKKVCSCSGKTLWEERKSKI